VSEPVGTGKKLVFWLILLGFVWGVFELVAYFGFSGDDDIFDHRAQVLARLNAADLARFAQKTGDPVLGWDHRGPRSSREVNCIGQEVGYSFDAAGARVYPGYEAENAGIIVIGDSYSNGAEVNDAETYPARLGSLLGVSVVNHGVGGYGPLQSLLLLEQKAARYPALKVAILGIMYENIYRMVNSYRAVLYEENSIDYGLKPYMAGGEIRPYPGADALVDIDRFKTYANRAFDEDFWAKPSDDFPYSLSLLRGLSSHYFYFRRFQKRFRKLGIPEYFLAFRSEAFLSELFPLLAHYTRFAQQHGLTPIAIFIPRNVYDTRSATRLIAEHRDRFPDGLVVGDVGMADIDWDRFNLISPESGDHCHPSAYGYEQIAEYVAVLLRDRGAWEH